MTRTSTATGPAAADALDDALLQHAQQHHLHFRRQFADFVQKDRPLVGQLKAADPPPGRAGEGPCSCPNNSLAITPGARAAQLTAASRRSRRGLSWWIARATSSLPVPVSPRMSTVLSVGATCWIAARTAFIARLSPVSERRSRSARASSRR